MEKVVKVLVWWRWSGGSSDEEVKQRNVSHYEH